MSETLLLLPGNRKRVPCKVSDGCNKMDRMFHIFSGGRTNAFIFQVEFVLIDEKYLSAYLSSQVLIGNNVRLSLLNELMYSKPQKGENTGNRGVKGETRKSAY